MNSIKLNFLQISERDFSFSVYRKLRPDGKNSDLTLRTYALPSVAGGTDKSGYLVSFLPKEGFEHYQANFLDSRNMTKKYLAWKLLEQLKYSSIFSYEYVEKGYSGDRIEFTIETYSQGRRIVYISPYFLEAIGYFGFLIDFRFDLNESSQFDKEVQMLSLSLSQDGNSNKNYYTDKFKIISNFLSRAKQDISSIVIDEQHLLTVKVDLCELPAEKLNKKEYYFFNKNTSYSQFQGIRNFGPFGSVSVEIDFLFIFQDKHRLFANDLYLSLSGKSNPGTFAGFQAMFKIHIGLDNVKRVTVPNLERESLYKVIQKVKDLKSQNPFRRYVAIYIEDLPIEGSLEVSDNYYFLKYHFIKENIPLQVVNYRKLGVKNALKWSTSNLALQIFAKVGGIPWLVKPSNNHCLILGIGSSHKRDPESGKILKYFAYTVCLDSSGLYKSLDILAESDNEETYLSQLQRNLVSLLSQGKFSDYRTCVLHLPFKIKNTEIEALNLGIQEVSDLAFVVIKVNLDSKFFGYSQHNTMVPYESSFLQLSKREYLVWFEGLIYGKELVDKRLSNPVHLEFLNFDQIKIGSIRDYLQDVLNLSGANWRGFNSKSVPISIYYSKIIAEYTRSFEDLDDYNEGDISNEQPWFL